MRYNALDEPVERPDPTRVVDNWGRYLGTADEWERLSISERWARTEPTAPARAADLAGRVVGLLWIACRFAAEVAVEFWPEILAAGLLLLAFGPVRGGVSALALALVARRRSIG